MSSADNVAARLLDKLDAPLKQRIALDPFAAARDDFGCDVVALDTPRERGEGGSCDGFSFLDDKIIYYRPTWSDRQFFTVAHELAHLLVEADDDTIDWITSQPDTFQLERVCDSIASRLLIPDELLAALGSPPTARHLALIHNTTSASRSACAIRLAQRMPCEGFIAIVDALQQRVFFAARHEDTRPYGWQGDPIPDVHHLGHIEAQRERKIESWWPYPNGERVRYYLNAYRDGDWIFAIFAERDLWQVSKFHAPESRQRDERPELELRCADCGYTGQFRGYPCSDCKQPYCPQCRRCDCERRKERSAACKRCGLDYAKHLLDENRVCVDCR